MNVVIVVVIFSSAVFCAFMAGFYRGKAKAMLQAAEMLRRGMK